VGPRFLRGPTAGDAPSALMLDPPFASPAAMAAQEESLGSVRQGRGRLVPLAEGNQGTDIRGRMAIRDGLFSADRFLSPCPRDSKSRLAIHPYSVHGILLQYADRFADQLGEEVVRVEFVDDQLQECARPLQLRCARCEQPQRAWTKLLPPPVGVELLFGSNGVSPRAVNIVSFCARAL